MARTWAHVGTPDFSATEGTLGGSGYTANVALCGFSLLTASYYDNYGFMETLCPDGMAAIPDTLSVRGLATGSVSTVGGGGLRVTQLGYDAEGRVALTQAIYDGRGVVEETAYTIDGRMERRTVTAMEAGGNAHTEEYAYSYDAQARLMRVTHRLNGDTEMVLTDNSYDALGRIATERKG